MSKEEPTPQTIQLSELVSGFVADTEAAAEARRTGRPRGPITGLVELDRIFGGFLAPGLHILQGAPGCGKTALSLQIASHCFYPCLYVTSEMPTLELFRRLIARETKTFLGKLKSGEVSGADARRLALATVEKLPHMAMMDATNAYASPALIQDVAGGLRERMSAEHVLIVIDSLQVWARSVRATDREAATASEYDMINAALFAAAGIASRLTCPVLMISHRNRVGNKEQGGLHASKGSGDVEYAAETILDLTPKADQQPDANGETEVNAKVVKNRHGVVGVTSRLQFCGRLQEFREGR